MEYFELQINYLILESNLEEETASTYLSKYNIYV